ncbi:hypothetical protein [Gallaecimonas mangrovi]|uniref:hypothetical protein n=1 Tax=Gallaecimonas mangrovi TaxID=2291597 RepID=UPI0012603166|nr:hypothetical protein [Gallaecimonas mangrovi]
MKENPKFFLLELIEKGSVSRLVDVAFLIRNINDCKEHEVTFLGAYSALFLRDRIKIRLNSPVVKKMKTVGLNSSLKTLNEMDDFDLVDVFSVKNNSYAGDCFVFFNKIIGIEFIKKGLSKKIEGFHPDVE